jgi:LuxR family maltose regulon positive regulatory protein
VEAAAARNGPQEMRDDAARVAASEPADSPWRTTCLLLVGVADHLAGRRDEAEHELEDALRQSVVTAPVVAALSAAQLAIIALDRDDWETASEMADQSGRIVAEHGLGDYPIAALTFAASAAARAHQGRVDEAKQDLLHCTHLLTLLRDFIPWYEVETRVLLARAALQLADIVRARTLLAEASRFARRTRDVAIFREWFDAAWGRIDEQVEISLVGPSSLTTAELRILRFLPTHLSFREIAKRLHVSSNTVKSQAHAVYRKLDASSRSEAVARATEAGLLGQ